MEKEKIYCERCGGLIENDYYDYVGDEIVCRNCCDDYTTICEHCEERIWDCDDCGDESITLCNHCRENHYTSCAECDRLVHDEDTYEHDGDYFCYDCYQEIRRKHMIHDYGYKPSPLFYGDGERYFGVELEIDKGGKDGDYAEEILDIANYHDDCLYIKTDSSLDDGMELVSHPMSLNYHKNYCWEKIMRHAIFLGYRSHQTSTCGLHVHINRNCFGYNRKEQEEIIAKTLYFVEHHWNEMLKFSRRSEYTMNRWAARYGYENSPKAILDKAKKGNCGRYAAVNLCNYNTIEFRLFRGTLKYNTFIATLELVDKICDTAMNLTEEELRGLSWFDFVAGLDDCPELIQYLKERQLYVNKLPFSETCK